MRLSEYVSLSIVEMRAKKESKNLKNLKSSLREDSRKRRAYLSEQNM